jgi:hypothetical protein
LSVKPKEDGRRRIGAAEFGRRRRRWARCRRLGASRVDFFGGEDQRATAKLMGYSDEHGVPCNGDDDDGRGGGRACLRKE